jgi:ribosomal protein S27AE
MVAEKADPSERYEGIDRNVLDEDVWAETPAKAVCPKCGLAIDPGAIRCPRCNALVIMACGGSCASCGSRSCVRREDLG